MSYPKETFKLLPSGVNLDNPKSDTDSKDEQFWTAGQNVIFRDGVTRSAAGWSSNYELEEAVLAVVNNQVGTDNYWVYQALQNTYAIYAGNSTNITLLAGLTTQPYPYEISLGKLNGIIFLNNGIDPPMYWDNDINNRMLELPDWPAGSYARRMVAHSNFLFAFGMEETFGSFPLKVMWSSAAEPGQIPSSWTATAANKAGSFIIAEGGNEFKTAVNLFGSLIVYKNSSTHRIDFVDGQNVFEHKTLFTNIGALTSRSVCDIGGQHFVVTNGDVIITNGTDKISIATQRVKQYLFRAMEPATQQMLFVQFYPAANEVWVCYPAAGNTYATEALIYDLSSQKWSAPRTLPGVSCSTLGTVDDLLLTAAFWDPDDSPWDDDSTQWDQPLFAGLTWDQATQTWAEAIFSWNQPTFSDSNQQFVFGAVDLMSLLVVDGSVTEDGTTVQAYIAKEAITLGSPERVKFVRRIHPRIEAVSDTTIYFRVGVQDNLNDNVYWAEEQPYVIGTDSFVDPLIEGKYITIQVRSEVPSVWKLAGMDVEFELRGY